MINTHDKTLWVVDPEILAVRTLDGLGLLDFQRDTYCDLALLSSAVWLAIQLTPTGITIREIVDLLEQIVPAQRHVLESETCRVVAGLARDGFVRNKPSCQPVSEHANAQRGAFYDQIERKVSTTNVTQRLVSLGARSRAGEDGAILLNIKEGRCYTLNEVALQVWFTIERNPAGISLERIVDVLESHFTLTREELQRAASDCAEEFHLECIVGKKVVADEPSYAMPLSSPTEVRVLRFGHQRSRTSIGNQPFIRRLETLESYIDRLFPQGVETDMEWRANKLKKAIDDAPAKVNESLGHVCSELQLSLTERQARRLFKKAAGISMKEYTRKSRLVLAAKQLRDTDDPIKVIATNAGYRTQLGFRKAFHDMFSLTPVEFRRFWHRHHVAV